MYAIWHPPVILMHLPAADTLHVVPCFGGFDYHEITLHHVELHAQGDHRVELQRSVTMRLALIGTLIF